MPKSDALSYVKNKGQQFDTKVRKFAQELQEGKVTEVLFAGMDATNLGLSSKMIFEAKNSTADVSSSEIAAEWREWLHTPDGIAITSVELAILLSCAMFGSYFDEKDENLFFRYSAIIWPYLRDALKALKWAYKATRNWLQIISYFSEIDLRFLILPIGLTFGTTALINRFWQRSMKNERKAMMKQNGLLREEILAQSCIFHELPQIPSLSDSDKIYTKSYVYIKSQAKACGFQQVTEPLTNDKLLKLLEELPKNIDASYVCNQEKIYYLDKITRDIHLIPTQSQNIKGLLQALNPSSPEKIRLLADEDHKNISKWIHHSHFFERRGLFYIDANNQKKAVNIRNLDAFEADFQHTIQENLLNTMGNKLKDVKSGRNKLTFLPKDAPIDQTYWGGYIYSLDTSNPREKLRFIDQQGQYQPLDDAFCKQFEMDYQRATKNKNLITLSHDQFQALIKKHTEQFTEEPIGLNIKEWDSYKQRVLARRIGAQRDSLPFRCYLAAAYSAIVDGLYFQSGAAMTVSALPPPFLIATVVCSAFLAVALIVGRIYEEYDFQRKLKITATQVKLTLCVKELDILLTELKQITTNLSPLDRDNNAKLEGQDPKIEELTQRFNLILKEYQQYSEELQKQLEYTHTTAALEGLRCGLAFQSALASFMFAVATILFVAAVPCPPSFVITCVFVGVAALFAFVCSSLISHHYHVINQPTVNTLPQQPDLNHERLKFEYETSGDLIENARSTIWDETIEPPPQYSFVEWCETVRLALSGGIKGEKGVGDLAGSKSTAILALMGISAGIASGTYALRATSKGFGASSPDNVSSKSQHPIKITQPMTLKPTTPLPENSSTKTSFSSSSSLSQPPSTQVSYTIYGILKYCQSKLENCAGLLPETHTPTPSTPRSTNQPEQSCLPSSQNHASFFGCATALKNSFGRLNKRRESNQEQDKHPWWCPSI